ncbi:MAG: trimethylamine methyltransferase family protein [Anaerolineales bacterium]|nr:trimethylamine methyltransferase family protein [Anaerolineales bacterium]
MTIRSNDRFFNSTQFRRLSDEQCRKLYWACLEILERTGIRLYSQEALDLLKKAGVSASDGNRVRIPAGLVEKALTSVPHRVTLCDRAGRRVMPVEGYRTFFGPGSDCLNIIDHRSSERRKAVLQDIVEAMTVADALPHIDFVMCMFLPEDVPQVVVDRYQMEVMLNTTTKPIIFVTTDFSGCVDAVEMAEVVVGGPEALQRNPLVAPYINVTTGLVHNEEAVQKLLYMAGKGLPAIYVPSTQGGATAPVTPAGALAMAQAGALVGVVLSQLKREGAPIIMPGWGGNMLDMRTTVQPYADPDKRTLAADYVHSLGLPMFALAGCSESKVVDQQAGIEAALTLMTDALAGANIVHDLGYLESGLTGSLAQLVICDEIVGWLEHFVAGVEINDETLALDLIDEIGPDGHFLDTDHTFKHFRERWYPHLFERDNYEGWLASGGQTLGERAAARVTTILAEHKPEPLPEDVAQKIRAIVRRAEEGRRTF